MLIKRINSGVELKTCKIAILLWINVAKFHIFHLYGRLTVCYEMQLNLS